MKLDKTMGIDYICIFLKIISAGITVGTLSGNIICYYRYRRNNSGGIK